jgi:3-hydroxymyristoyl/3-hydroxydecanoyl-(acyl carrier protein) dehydratase
MSGAAVSATVVRHCRIAADHPAFAGHFPGQPLLPGVSLLAEVLEAWRAAATGLPPLGPGALVLGAAKFLAPVGPGAALRIELTPGPAATPRQLRFAVWQGEVLAASGSFSAGDAA